jgi:proline iminopeptidase
MSLREAALDATRTLLLVDPRGSGRTGPADSAARWNEMFPFSFASWDERYRPLVEVAVVDPGPARAFNESDFDLRPDLGRIDADTLVITGREDFVCGPVAAQPFADGIPKAELVLPDGAGHFPFLEQPEAFRSVVEAFLSG